MLKRFLSLLLAFVMVAGMLPAMTVAAEESSVPAAIYVGCDTETKGAWEGNYGADSAILYGYGKTMTEQEAAGTTQFSRNCNTDTYVYKAADSKLDSTAAILQGATDIFCNPGYAADDAVLDMPSGVNAEKFRVYASGKMRFNNNPDNFWGHLVRDGFDGLYGTYDTGVDYVKDPDDSTKDWIDPETGERVIKGVKSQTLQGRFSLSFADGGERLISVYGYAPFKNQSSYPVILTVLDGEDNQLARQAVPLEAFNSGAYMTFKTTGEEIQIIVETRDCCNGLGIAGIFVDPITTGGEDSNEEEPVQTKRLADDTTTKGAWEDVYGTDAAILFGYNTDTYPSNDTVAALTDKLTWYPYTHNEENLDSTLIIKKTDSSLSNFKADLGGKHIFYYKTHPVINTVTDADAAVLNLPKSMQSTYTKRLMYAVGRITETQTDYFITNAFGSSVLTSGQQRQSIYTLNLTEGAHKVSLYGYAAYTALPTYVTIYDLEGNVLLTDTIAAGTFADGTYVSYQVPGSVKILLVNKNDTPGYNTGLSGIFVDPVEQTPGEGGGSEGGGESGEPEEPPASAVPGMLRTDTATKGDWQGRYGLDTAILFGYKFDATIDLSVIDKSKGLEDVKNSSGRFIVNKDTMNLMVHTTAAPYNDSVYLYFGGNLWSYEAAQDDASVLTMPNVEGAGGKPFNAYAMNGVSYSGTSAQEGLDAAKHYGQITITPTDTNLHVLSLYSNKTQAEPVHVRIVDEQGNLLAEDTIPAGSLTGGGYASFPLQAKTANKKVYIYFGATTKNSFGFNALFLDTLQNVASDLTAVGEAGDGAKLTWTNGVASAGCQSQIQRSEDDGTTWKTIAAVSGTTYTDPGLTPGKTYTYRVSTVFGTMISNAYSNTAAYTAEEHVEVYVPVYTDKDSIFLVTTDNTTRGNWEGIYGKDIAFLYGYAYDATNEVQKNDRFAVDHNKKDLVITKDGLGYTFTHSYNSNGNLQCWAPGVNVDADTVLNMPAGITRPKFETVAGSSNAGNCPDYTFTFSDDGVHLLSLYNEHGSAGSLTLTFVDPDTDAVLYTQTLKESVFKGGAYLSYLVSGKVKVIMKRTTASSSFSGVFVDALADCPISDLTAQAGTKPRSIKLTWTETDVPAEAQVIIERKLGDGQWERAAVCASGAGTYQDENLLAGESYTYRLRIQTAVAAYSASSLTAKFDVPAYTQTALTLDQAEYVVEDTTRDITVKATLVNGEDAGIAGQTVTLTLDFEHSIQTMTAVTDANGAATFTFKPDYLGLAFVEAKFADNDDAGLMHATVAAELYVGLTEWKAAPVIWSISDGVLPGNLISLNGYGMADVANLKVYYAPHGTAITDSSATLAIENSDGVYGYYVIAQLPVDAQPGLYDLAVANSYGMSEVMTLNIARPLFIDEYEAWNGQTIMLSGRNLEGAQFGYNGTTKVRLVSGGEAVEQTITKLTPYSIRFTVSGTVGTTYEVEVSNNGGTTWGKLDSNQTLTIVPVGLDPLNLGVSWADHYNWSAPYLNVTDYGAVAGDNIDDTAAFQAALNAAGAQNGGGVVYVPNGKYLVGNVKLPAYTVLLGESTEKTVLLYYNPNANNGGGQMFANTKDSEAVGQIGLANFSVRMYDDAVRPDTFLWLGHAWGTANKDQTVRTAKEMFVSGVDIAYSYAEAQQRGLGMVFLGDERVIIKDSSFVGFQCNTQSCYVNQYCRYIGNYYSFDEGAVGSVALYNFVLDCTVNDVNRENAQDNHAFMMRQTTHWEGNWVEGTGNETNVGEAFCVEMPGGVFAIGQVINSTANTVKAIFPNQEPERFTVMYGRLAVTITSGKGMGQVRDIESYDLTTGEIVLKDNWAVLPDATSRFTINCPLDRVTVYNNGMDDNTKGVFMYGNGYDNVVANNYLEDSEGIFIYSSDVLPMRSTPNYFTTVRDNVLNGPGTENSYVNISMRSNRPSGGGGTYFCTAIYAIEVRNNILVGDGTQPPSENCSEANIANGLSSNSAVNNGDVGTDGVFGDNLGILWENNELQHLSHGFEVSKADYGFAYKGNVLIDVETVLKNEIKPGQNVTGLSDAELAEAPAVTKQILENYVSLYKVPGSISGYTEVMAALLAKVVAQAEAVLADSTSDAYDYASALTRLRIAASMREIPQGGDEIEAILLNEVACIDCADQDGDGICDACGHVFTVATIGIERYGTLQAAVKAARKDQTIVLVADHTVATLALVEGVTLDLNGHTVEAEYLVALNGNAVIDSTGDGLLKSKYVRLAKDNGQMPVWDTDAEGYRLFTMLDYQEYLSQDANGFTFSTKPALGAFANDKYFAADANQLVMKARISWTTDSGNDVEQMFTVKAADLKTAYADDNMEIQLKVTGTGALKNKLWVTTWIESSTGVIWTGNALKYTGETGK